MSSSYDPHSASRYLESQVLTASQPELQTLLLDGAVRSTRRARQLAQEMNGWMHAEAQLSKATEIVAALVQGAAEGKAEVSKQLEEEYAFLFRELTSARVNQDLTKLDAAIELLEYERETWRLASEKFGQRNDVDADAPQSLFNQYDVTPDSYDGGFSLEA